LGKGSFDFGAQGWVQCKVAGFMAVYISAVKFTTLKVSRKFIFCFRFCALSRV